MEPDEDEFPPPLPPTKIPKPVTTEPMGHKFQCSVCRTKAGVLTCTRCRSVRYCEKACQKKQWNSHKDICAKVKAAFEETKNAAIVFKTFQESPESEPVNIFESEQYFDGINILENEEFMRYNKARSDLIDALESCGENNESELAFDLAAGNFMDNMMLKYTEYWFHEGIRDDLVSYLVNANLDQQAFDVVRYFYLHEKTREPLPYLSIETQDIETSFTQSEVEDFQLCDKMAIALVKYKRIRYLEFQQLCEGTRFKHFMMGTHHRVGKDSPVFKIRGISVIMDKLSDFILNPLEKRVRKLYEDVENLLKSANTNQYVIPGILNPDSIPPIDNRPLWTNAQGKIVGHGTDEEMDEDLKVRDALGAVNKIGRAWRLAMYYMIDRGFLESMLSRGTLPKRSGMPRIDFMISEHKYKGRECNITDKELYNNLEHNRGLVPWILAHMKTMESPQVDLDIKTNRGMGLEECVDKGKGSEEEQKKWKRMEASDSRKESKGIVIEKKRISQSEYGVNNFGGATKHIARDKDDVQMDDAQKAENTEKGTPGSSAELKVDYDSVCWNCMKTEVELTKCEGCQKANYCSRECWKEDQPVHGRWCRKKHCWGCKKTGVKLFMCEGCQKARYCKRECIERDWDNHEHYCLQQQEKRGTGKE